MTSVSPAVRPARRKMSSTGTVLLFLLPLACTVLADQGSGPAAAATGETSGRRLADSFHRRGGGTQHSKERPRLKRIMLANRTVTCNDGSPSGYYMRKSFGSKRWLIFLEGGWYCFNKNSCESRWIRMRNLMSSKSWPDFRHVGGILSLDAEENPYWWNANHVYVPYCSSDSWSGQSPARTRGEFAFMGSLILQEVVKDLLHRGLLEAHTMLLAGSSAGGTGVLMNLDRIADLLQTLGLTRIQVRGLSDSGWFLDNEPYEPMPCTNPDSCAPVEAVKLGIRTWNGQVPDRCRAGYPASEHWRCYFGYRLYPSLKTPVFIFQWLFDEAQMTADNVGAPVTKKQWDYIHKMGFDLRATLKNVTAVFAPSCISHVVLTKRDWMYVKVNHISLPQALHCWEIQKQDLNQVKQQSHHDNHHRPHHNHHHNRHTKYDGPSPSIDNNNSSTGQMLADMPQSSELSGKLSKSTLVTFNSSTAAIPVQRNRRNREGKRRQRRPKKRRRKNQERKRRPRKQGDKRGGHLPYHNNTNHRGRVKRSSLFSPEEERPWRLSAAQRLDQQQQYEDEVCRHWLVDECSWPQCNRACPRLHNPFTGEEMDFMELLKSFGLDMASVANALGIDLATLNEMDNDTLLQLLTQQTN